MEPGCRSSSLSPSNCECDTARAAQQVTIRSTEPLREKLQAPSRHAWAVTGRRDRERKDDTTHRWFLAPSLPLLQAGRTETCPSKQLTAAVGEILQPQAKEGLACARTDALRWYDQTRRTGHIQYCMYILSQHPCLISPPLWRVKRAVVICQASRPSLHLMSRLSRDAGSGSGSHCQRHDRVSGRFLSATIVSSFCNALNTHGSCPLPFRHCGPGLLARCLQCLGPICLAYNIPSANPSVAALFERAFCNPIYDPTRRRRPTGTMSGATILEAIAFGLCPCDTRQWDSCCAMCSLQAMMGSSLVSWLRPPLPSGLGPESAKMRFAETPILSSMTNHNTRGCTRIRYLMLSSSRGLIFNETVDETWGAGFAAYCSKHHASAYEQKTVAYKQATKQPTSLLFNLGGQGGIAFNETHTHDMDVSLAYPYGRVPSQTRFLDCQMHEAALAWLVRLLPKGAVSKTAVRGVLEAGRRIVHFQVCTSCLPSMGALQVNIYCAVLFTARQQDSLWTSNDEPRTYQARIKQSCPSLASQIALILKMKRATGSDAGRGVLGRARRRIPNCVRSQGYAGNSLYSAPSVSTRNRALHAGAVEHGSGVSVKKD
ncbi:hypothetical protein TgHK011_005624 [Trichoderma gracile]|nr:hypothetical protein TgHK011_005624 [Trichoderma gracile]